MAQRLPTYDHFLRGLRNYDLPPNAENWCEICYGEFTNPIRLDCGHIYCEDCLFQALADRNNCPKCRRVLFQARPYSEEEGRYDIRDTDNSNGRQRAGLEPGEIDEDEGEEEDDDEIYDEEAAEIAEIMQAILARRATQNSPNVIAYHAGVNFGEDGSVQRLNISGGMVVRMRGSSSDVVRESVTWVLRQTSDTDPVWGELRALEEAVGDLRTGVAIGSPPNEEVAILRDIRQRYRTGPGGSTIELQDALQSDLFTDGSLEAARSAFASMVQALDARRLEQASEEDAAGARPSTSGEDTAGPSES